MSTANEAHLAVPVPALSNVAQPPPLTVEDLHATNEKIEKEKKSLAERMRVMNEFLQTEIGYLQDLKSLKQLYIDPLVKDTEILPKDEFHIIFSNVVTILDLHDKLFDGLKNAIIDGLKKNETSQFVNAFRSVVDFFNMYSIYCANRANAIATQEKCRKKYAKFDKFLNEIEARNEPLDSLLIKPVQRLCRYPLLLTAMLQKTPDTHPEHQALNKLLERVQLVANNVNEFSKKKHNDEKFFDISQRLVDFEEPLSTPSRHIIMERESIEVVGPFTRFKREEYYVVVFSDMILFLKPRKKKLAFKYKALFETINWRQPETIVDDEWPLVIIDSSSGKNLEITLFEPSKRSRDALVRALETTKQSRPAPVVVKPTLQIKSVGSLKKSVSSEGLQTPRLSARESSDVPRANEQPFAPPMVKQHSMAALRRHTVQLEMGVPSLGVVPEEIEPPRSPGQGIIYPDSSRSRLDLNATAATVSGRAQVKRNRRKSLPPSMIQAYVTSAETENVSEEAKKTNRVNFKLLLEKKLTSGSASSSGHQSNATKEISQISTPHSAHSSRVQPAPIDPVAHAPTHSKAADPRDDEIQRLRRENQLLKDRVSHLETVINLFGSAMRGIESAASSTKSLWNIVRLSEKS